MDMGTVPNTQIQNPKIKELGFIYITKKVETDQAQIARADIIPAPRNKKQ